MVQLVLSRSLSQTLDDFTDFLAVKESKWLLSQAHCSLKPSRSLPAMTELSSSWNYEHGRLQPFPQHPMVWPAHDAPRLAYAGARLQVPNNDISADTQRRTMLQSSIEENGSWTVVEVTSKNQDVRRMYNAYLSRVVEQ
mmetsp:Transcript_17556/g.39703  ORF Transcript_17556/g.39703 Transcript_17556/m.39703 type:complete len:139 (-) Transcript_17556:128-544(-)|eukprot:764775-Hanusia_phi.AAC.3